jgi:cytochrome c oxidase cbb3-type subunit III
MKTAVAMLLWAAGACLAQNPFANDPKAIDVARGMFRIYCAPCHGIDAQGGRGPDLTTGTYLSGSTNADLFRVIGEGVGGTEMPAYKAAFDNDALWRMVAYVRSTTRQNIAPVPGNPVSGQKLFWAKGQCGQCHRVGNRGSRMGPDRMGPDLTLTGRRRSAAYLRESIVSPDADLTPGAYTIKVTTRDGKKLSGVQKGFDTFSAQFMDASENFYSFSKDEVTSMNRELRSLMPSGYAKLFSPAEIDDLVAWLTTLRSTEVPQ